MVAEYLHIVYSGDLDGGNWAVADFDSTPRRAVAGRAMKVRDSFGRI